MKTIYNIFTKKQAPPGSQPTKGGIQIGRTPQAPFQKITADYREKNSLIASELFQLGITVEFKELKVADYIVKDVAIERKTVSDFISSMLNKRLLRQLEELQQYSNKLLIIEGIDEQELYTDKVERRDQPSLGIQMGGWAPTNTTQIHPNSIRGFLLSILLKHKIPIIFTKDYKDTARFISVIAKKQTIEMSLNVKKKALNKKEQKQFILEGFPGIGPKTAKKLLKEFKTIKNILNASIEKIQESIGKKAEIFRLIDENY